MQLVPTGCWATDLITEYLRPNNTQTGENKSLQQIIIDRGLYLKVHIKPSVWS